MSRIPAILICFLCSGLAFGQGQIKGKLLDQGVPLEFASVAVFSVVDSSLVNGGITDPEGMFSVGDLSPGLYFLIARSLGYRSLVIEHLTVDRNQQLDLGNISLLPDAKTLQTIDVQGQRIATEFRPEKKSFSAESFEAALGGTATDVLKNLPGVSIDAQGRLSIRGTSGFVVMVDGRPSQGDPMVILGQMPANTIKKVEWISAPGAQYDSEGKAGIINITTKKGATDGLFLQANAKIALPSIEDYNNPEPQRRYGGISICTISRVNGIYRLEQAISEMIWLACGSETSTLSTAIRRLSFTQTGKEASTKRCIPET